MTIAELLSGLHLFGGAQKADPRASSAQPDGQDLVEVQGTVVLAKKNFLDVQDQGADAKDTAADRAGHTVQIRLVSVDLDPETREPKVSAASSIRDWGREDLEVATGEDEYPITFNVPSDFGEPGALLVTNDHPNEFFLTSLSIHVPDNGTIHFLAESVVFNASKYTSDRIFFSSKAYLPADTPAGIKALREQELEVKRGNGTGQRESWDRVYDYDVYNDLSAPDSDPSTIRPVLGGSQERPYPRRVKTGRPPSKTGTVAADPHRCFLPTQNVDCPPTVFLIHPNADALLESELEGGNSLLNGTFSERQRWMCLVTWIPMY